MHICIFICTLYVYVHSVHCQYLLLLGVTMNFSASSYSVTEGETLEVCLMFSGGIPNGHTIDFSLTTVSGSAVSTLGENELAGE